MNGSQTIVVAAKDEDGDAVDSYEHLGLHTPDVIELRYRLYAVTDEDGDAETVDDRRISRAASETATGRTVRPSDKPDPRFESPPAVGNLRAVVYTTGPLRPMATFPSPATATRVCISSGPIRTDTTLITTTMRPLMRSPTGTFRCSDGLRPTRTTTIMPGGSL